MVSCRFRDKRMRLETRTYGIEALMSNKALPKSSCLFSLHPFLDLSNM